MSRTRNFILFPLIAIVAGGAIQVFRPLPSVQLRVAQNQPRLPGELSVPFPNQGQVAIGEQSLGPVAETPHQEPVAIASLTKMMTAYLLLQARPLKVGEDGPISTLTATDVAEYEKCKANGYSLIKVTAGEKLTERQQLEALLLPSADNIATLIAKELAGSEANFVEKMNETAQSLGMKQTTYADASGVNPATVSTAHDQILLAQAVMQIRVFRDVVRMPQADLPVAGRVYNVNFMVGKQGITGIKTGSTLAAGSCFVGSYPVTIDGTPRLMLCAVLGQRSLHEAITSNTNLLHGVAPQFKNYQVPVPSDGLAQLTTAWKQTANLKPSQPLHVFGYPGMPITLSAKLTQGTLPIPAGQKVAVLTAAAGQASMSIDLVLEQPLQQPDLLWRLHR